MNSFHSFYFIGFLTIILALPAYGDDMVCKAEVSDFDFGNIVTGNTQLKHSANGQIKLSCSNRDTVPLYVSICLNGPQVPGALNESPLTGMGYSILFRDRNTGLPWDGDNSPVRILRTLKPRTAMTETIPLSAEIIFDPLNTTSGLLDHRLTLQSPSLSWYASAVPYGDSCLAPRPSDPISFSIRANIPKRCDVTADNIDFGRIIDMSASSVFSQSSINIRCTNEVIYSVALRSLNGSGTPFIMENAANVKIPYTLHKDPARTDIWAEGINAKKDRGTGKWQQHTVYGQIKRSPLATLASGDYTDTVIISLHY